MLGAGIRGILSVDVSPLTVDLKTMAKHAEAVALAAAPSADPFGVSGDPHALMGGAPPQIRPAGDVDAWHRKLCTSASGVLYEDTCLQVALLRPSLVHGSSSPCSFAVWPVRMCGRQGTNLDGVVRTFGRWA